MVTENGTKEKARQREPAGGFAHLRERSGGKIQRFKRRSD
jgi:hypothetical protein